MRLSSSMGLIRIPTFSSRSGHGLVAEFDAAMDELMDAPGLILDLRGNSGGSTLLANPIAGRCLTEPVTYGRDLHRARLLQRGWRAWKESRVAPHGSTCPGRLALLIDEGTSSSAERFVVALGDSGRVRTVDRTTGGGSGNPMTFDLRSGGIVRFSTADFRRNDGTSIEGMGISPDKAVAWSVQAFRRGQDLDVETAELLLAAND